jgi:4-hydroxyproline epimerase
MKRKIEIVDSHTGGERTRVVISGGPDLGSGSLADQLSVFRDSCDSFRRAVINEPRGADEMVGALLRPPANPLCDAGVIFFNNVGYLGMCGHGAIGVVATLEYLRRIQPGPIQIESPVGIVNAELESSGKVTIENVPSYRLEKAVVLDVDGYGTVVGDIAWGGNWFFLVEERRFDLDVRNVEQLTAYASQIRHTLQRRGLTGSDGHEIDHIELFAESVSENGDSRNFVLCPGGAYDRSPCGTGTSAKLACLYADGKLEPGQIWRQEKHCREYLRRFHFGRRRGDSSAHHRSSIHHLRSQFDPR